MKLALKDKNGITYKLGDRVYNSNKNEYYTIKWNGYSYYAEGFYCGSQDNPCDFFGEYAYANYEIIREE